MAKKRIVNLPKGFFTKPRKVVTASEVLKDVVPVDLEDVSVIGGVQNKKISIKKNNK